MEKHISNIHTLGARPLPANFGPLKGANADVVLPSLDAGDEFRFRAINRPHERISFAQMVEGLVEFRREFRGQYWLEVFLLDGYTALKFEVAKLAEWVKRIQPDKVQLNTVADGLGLHPTEALKLVGGLERRHQVTGRLAGGQRYYQAAAPRRFCSKPAQPALKRKGATRTSR